MTDPILPGLTFLNCDGKRLWFRSDKETTQTLDVAKYHSPYCLLLCDNNIQKGRHRDSTEGVISQIEDKAREAREERYSGGGGDELESPYKYLAVDKDGHMLHTNPRTYRSFHNPNVRYRAIEVHTTQSWKVPDISTALFQDFGFHTAEFDVVYRERALIDLQGESRLWLFDTGGDIRELKVLAYDIETTQYESENKEVQDVGRFPIDMIGWASFSIMYRAKRDMKTGRCEFEFVSSPKWTEPEIKQIVAHDIDEEVKNLLQFIRLVESHHIVAGHNITQFDNKQIYDRLAYLKEGGNISEEDMPLVDRFVGTRDVPGRAKQTKIFFYGEQQVGVDIYPLSFDTLFAAKRIFFFLQEYNLKALAKQFGYIIPNRQYLDVDHIKIDTPEQEAITLKYNEHDVREQIGVTLHLLPDAMRLCHLTGMAFNDCLPAGTTKIWDYMTHIRAHQSRRIMPATAPAMEICSEIFHKFGISNPKTKRPYTKAEIADLARASLGTPNSVSARTLKVLKYGLEAPDYVMYPHLVYNPYNKKILHAITFEKCPCKTCQDSKELKFCRCGFCESLRRRFPQGIREADAAEQEEYIKGELRRVGHKESEEGLAELINNDRGFRNSDKGYHFPGGMTLHPEEVDSHFKMWWGIQVADVGCVHPDSLLMSKDGYKRAGDVQIGDEVLTPIGYQHIVDKRIKHTDEIVHIVTTSGAHVKVSPWHKFPVYTHLRQGGYVQSTTKIASEIVKGDVVLECIDYPRPADNVLPDSLKLNMAELVGIYDAEGSIRDEVMSRVRHDRGNQIQKGIRYTNLLFSIGLYETEFRERIEYLLRECFKHLTLSDEDYAIRMKKFEEDLVADYNIMSIPKLSKKYRIGGNIVYDILRKHGAAIRRTGVRIKGKPIDVDYSFYPFNPYATVKTSALKFNIQRKKERNGVVYNGISMQIGLSCVVDEFKKWISDKSWILAHKDYCRAYAKGFIEGDGCLNVARDCYDVTQSTINADNIYFLRKALIRFGVHSSVYKYKTVAGGCSKNPVISLKIGKNFCDKIEVVSSRKKWRSACRIDYKYGEGLYKKVSQVYTIKDAAEVVDVVDFTVENQDYASFFCEGINLMNSMYPSNLRAENIGGDTTRFADPALYVFDGVNLIKPRKKTLVKETYKWVWLRRVRADIAKNFMVSISADELKANPIYKSLFQEYKFVNEGYLVAIVIDDESGGVADAMAAVLDVTSWIKRRKFELAAPDSGATDIQKTQIANAYQSMKGLRNSGSLHPDRKVALNYDSEMVDVSISEFYDKFNVSPYHENINGVEFEIKHVSEFEWYAPTMKDDGETVIDLVVNVIRHPYSGPLVRVKTASGCETIVTPNHSVFTMTETGLQKVEPEEATDIVTYKDDADTPCFYDLIDSVSRFHFDGYVYDLEMSEVHNFFDASGVLTQNTHGILSAPTVSCRQFSLSGAARITTLGQCVLDDVMDDLDKIGARKVYGDTDGIYCSNSRHASSLPPLRSIFSLPTAEPPFMDPALFVQTIDRINKKWQTRLNYKDYALELEEYDGMLFVKHKNYIIFNHIKDKKTGALKLEIKSKGNNFKASDKAPLTIDALKKIMERIAKTHVSWADDKEEYTHIRDDIKRFARETMDSLDVNTLGLDKFTFRQAVAPMGQYKQPDTPCMVCKGTGYVPNKDKKDEEDECPYCCATGFKLNHYAARSNAIERLLGIQIRAGIVLQCVVCNNPLPFIDSPRKSDTKPLPYMWPVDLVQNDAKAKEASGGIDFQWYKDMVFNYIKGAFGFDTWNFKQWVCTMKQMTLDGGFTVKIVPGAKFEKDGVFAAGSKTINCDAETFAKLKKGEPIPDDLAEKLMAGLPPESSPWGEGWGEGFEDDPEFDREDFMEA